MLYLDMFSYYVDILRSFIKITMVFGEGKMKSKTE
jgi:hypothetical protein